MNKLSQLPSVDSLLLQPAILALSAGHGRTLVTTVVRASLSAARENLKAGLALRDEATLIEQVSAALAALATPKLRPVFNLTGTVLHTNLGRAVLPPEAVAAMVAAALSPCALEYDLASGGRGDRDDVVNDLLCELTGAEAATVVNNNAAAVFLLLNTLAQNKQVLVSRGELIEIGGAFRVPDIMKRAGAKLVEVGTTNRTHLKDFSEVLEGSHKAALLMKVHASNYAIQGFTHAVPEHDLAALAHRHQLPFVIDLGSGTLTDLSRWNLPHEPTPREAITAGADLVTFSGDKLLGGPQAGLLVGKKELISRIKKNPLKRALRVGKITLAALEAVLRLYRDPDRLAQRLTTLRHLTRTEADIRAAALRLLPRVQQCLAAWPVIVTMESLISQIGSGSLPVERLPSTGFALRPQGKRSGILNRLDAALRKAIYPAQPIIGRIDNAALLLDLRCLDPDHEAGFLQTLEQLCARTKADA
jgi:L-seryl-tRNA(Ser) seleniumtransferase